MAYLSKMVIFHGYVTNNQRVYPHMYLAELREWTTLTSSQRWVQQGVPSSNIFRPCQELEDEFPPGIGQFQGLC